MNNNCCKYLKKEGIRMDNVEMNKGNKKSRSLAMLQFILFSALGVFLFFVNIPIDGQSKVPLLHIISFLTNLIGMTNLSYLVMIGCIVFLAMSLYTKFGKNVPELMKEIFGNDSMLTYFSYVTAVIFVIMIIFNFGPEQILNPDVGESSLGVAVDSFMAMVIAGSIVPLILEFGFLDFVGRLMAPLMRRIFKVPGSAAVDALTSFVAAPAVGVMVTDSLYRQNIYTQKEAASIMTNFSIASLGGFAFLSAIAGIPELYGPLVISAFICVFLIAIIVIRIPPLSNKKSEYSSGVVQTDEERIPENYNKNTIKRSIEDGISKAQNVDIKFMMKELLKSVAFAFKVNSFIISLSVIGLTLANYTPIVDWIGMPMVPILRMLGLDSPEVIAAPSIVGIIALSLPATLIKGKAIAASSAFFVILLSTTQIIFFTESANAMLESNVKLSFFDLVSIFIVRTIFLIPLVTIITKILVG